MSRLSFDKKRAQQPAEHSAVVPVRVFGAGGASVGGTPVGAAPGEEIQQAVLNHLQRLAISLGAPVHATVQDDRVGLVVPLEVCADGSSRVTGEPVRTAPPGGAEPARASRAPAGRLGPPPVTNPPQPAGDTPVPLQADTAGPAAADPAPASAPAPAGASVPVPEPAGVTGPATGPAPVSTPFTPAPAPLSTPAHALSTSAHAPGDTSVSVSGGVPLPAGVSAHPPEGAGGAAGRSLLVPLSAGAEDVVSSHTPARGFDAVAEEMLGDGPLTETAEGAELLAEPMARISEAVRAGRIEAAAELADRAVTEASTVLGPGHAEVLRVRELSAYIAYLGGDPVRAFEQSLDLARLRRQARDAEAAYGNMQSAATAWRAVRDPEEGLRLGRDLIELWADLSTEPGPAADDPRPLESARARMVRLTDRAARAAQP